MRKKQSVRGGVCHLGGKRRWRKRGQRGVFLPIVGLLGSVVPSLIGEIAKPILKTLLVGEEGEDDERKKYC